MNQSIENKIIPEDINLFKIDVLESAVRDSGGNIKDYNLNVGKSVMHNIIEGRIKIGLIIDLSVKEIPNESASHFVIDFHFEIKNLSNFYKLKEDEQPLFSGVLIATLLGLSFSTARGIIFEKLAANNLKDIILPVIDPNKLLQSEN